MWFDVPPNGIGAPVPTKPGSSQRNQVSYSVVNHRVIRFWSALW
jgi:hypothetical protein